MYKHDYACIYIYIYLHNYVCIYKYVLYIYIYLFIYLCTNIYIYKYICTSIYICIYAPIYICTQPNLLREDDCTNMFVDNFLLMAEQLRNVSAMDAVCALHHTSTSGLLALGYIVMYIYIYI